MFYMTLPRKREAKDIFVSVVRRRKRLLPSPVRSNYTLHSTPLHFLPLLFISLYKRIQSDPIRFDRTLHAGHVHICIHAFSTYLSFFYRDSHLPLPFPCPSLTLILPFPFPFLPYPSLSLPFPFPLPYPILSYPFPFPFPTLHFPYPILSYPILSLRAKFNYRLQTYRVKNPYISITMIQ